MSIKDPVLTALEARKGECISGAELARALGTTRNAVWKAIESLRAQGHHIEAVTNRGYTLSALDPVLTSRSVESRLFNCDGFYRIETYTSVTSTNDLVLQRAKDGEHEGLVIIADAQSAGHGRRERSFYSPEGTGLYMSILLRPRLRVSDAAYITTAAAVAVCRAIENLTGERALIKWVNDVFVDGKKVCGILTHAATDLESGMLTHAVLGIGINLCEPGSGFPADIADIAGALYPYGGAAPDSKSGLAAFVLSEFCALYRELEKKSFKEEYISRSMLTGCTVDVIKPGCVREATVLGIDDMLNLIVEYPDGTAESLFSGEVSIKKRS